MKRNIIIIAIALIASLMLCGCGATKTDENGFYQDLDTASKYAQKKNKDILVAVTMAGDDYYSSDIIENVLKTEEFKKEIQSEYAVVLMDFSQTSYEKTVISENATKEEQKASEEYANIMQNNSKVASMLNVQMTPSFYIFSKEKYFITQLDYTDTVQSYDDFKTMLSDSMSKIEEIHSMLTSVKKGSNLERVSAIDTLYESIDYTYRTFYSDLIQMVIKLDKNNESGLVSKYLLADADVKGSQCYMSGDSYGASAAYIKVCDEKFLSPEHKQQAYYMGAYILAMSGSTNYKEILQYLQMAVNAAPESEAVPSIQSVLQYLSESFASMGIENSTLGE